MTPNEIQALIVGIAIGAQTTFCLNAYWSAKAARRAAAIATAVRKRQAGDEFHASLYAYLLRHGTWA
ncbi:hypothetical protein [Streptomyces sp. NPDC059759]|uniref:hypothetical protein n=1 Tax=Streptomyces sp. NPDC059759 TaxID=3346936 RepID=UPI0036553AD7